MKIWLSDLTYTQQSISSDVVPAAIAMIAEYTEKAIEGLDKIELFKYPEELSKSLENTKPDLIGFSNYVWNSSLTDTYLKRIKEVYPEVFTVVGGPNFPTDKNEQEVYLKERPWIDFYIVKEGEHAFSELIKNLIRNEKKFNLEELSNLPNLVFLKNSHFCSSNKIERIMDLSAIPSPYLTGRLDKFLDGKLLPITQTNRGCPFSCSFCTEGQSYWTKVKRKSREVVEGEISYISEKMNSLPANKKRTDLLISDSNFGMFAEDLDTCKAIAKEQEKTGYPKYINVATGKNKKERVLEAASIVNGAMKLAGSVQSLDETVQKNIKRKNISSNEIVDMALKSSKIGANTYSEVILALPGDTKEKHFKTLETLIESSFNTISMYQLMMLPGTELGSLESKTKHGMQTKFRVVPRCYGYYNILGKKLCSAEIEEICTSNNTLSFEDYLECRKMNLIVNIFYNDGVFDGIIKFLNTLNISIWSWLKTLFENSTKHEFSKFNKLLDDFLNDSENELWTDYSKLREFCNNTKNIDKFLQGELGSNLIFKYKSRSLTKDIYNVAKIAEASTIMVLEKYKLNEYNNFISDLISYKLCEIEDLFKKDKTKKKVFKYDINKFLNFEFTEDNFNNLKQFEFNKEVVLTFNLNQDQENQIESYNSLFGSNIEGISRTLSRVYIKKLFRSLASEQKPVHPEFSENNSRRWGGGLESI